MAATLAAGLFFYSSCTPAEKTDTKDYTQYVNTDQPCDGCSRLALLF